MRRTILLLLLLAAVLFSFAGRLIAAAPTVIASANVRHQACITVYTTGKAYRKLHPDCVFGSSFD